MPQNDLAVIILAAGKGTRMRSRLPKVMHPIAGRPMIQHLMDTITFLSPKKTIVVIGPDSGQLRDLLDPASIAVQIKPSGTAHAVLSAREKLSEENGTVLVLFGADPLVRSSTLTRLVDEQRAGSTVVTLGFRTKDPAQYGRLIVGSDGQLESIVEYKDANESQRSVNLCNAGAMAIDSSKLWTLLDRVRNNNKKREYYLTDIVSIANGLGLRCSALETSERELIGVDTQSDLARAEGEMQWRLRSLAMDNGVRLVDPETVWFSYDTKIESDVVIEPNVIFGLGVRIASGARIRSFSHIEEASIGSNAIIGPFARIRPGSIINDSVHVGNFVEVKNSDIAVNAKVNHLAYVGDSSIGENANIGAGTITANYDGYRKSRTEVGADSSIGSNSVLVAPVRVGDGAVVGAGSVVRDHVPKDALFVQGNRKELRIIKDWAKMRRKKESEKGK